MVVLLKNTHLHDHTHASIGWNTAFSLSTTSYQLVAHRPWLWEETSVSTFVASGCEKKKSEQNTKNVMFSEIRILQMVLINPQW